MVVSFTTKGNTSVNVQGSLTLAGQSLSNLSLSSSSNGVNVSGGGMLFGTTADGGGAGFTIAGKIGIAGVTYTNIATANSTKANLNFNLSGIIVGFSVKWK